MRDINPNNSIIILSASDGLETTAMVKVTILDANDNHPVFYPVQYNQHLPEDSAVGTEVLVVRAPPPTTFSYLILPPATPALCLLPLWPHLSRPDLPPLNCSCPQITLPSHQGA